MFLQSLILLIVVVWVLFKYLMTYYKFWDQFNVPVLKPKYPWFGNNFDVLFSLKPRHMVQWECYNKYPDARIIGSFLQMTPNLIIKDADLVEATTIRQFAYASDRGGTPDQQASYLNDHLVNRTGESWKILRTKLTPVFSTLKIKNMFHQALESANSLVTRLEKYEGPIDISDIVARFTIDVVCPCVFGLSTDIINQPNHVLREFGQEYSKKYSIFRKLKQSLGAQKGLVAKLLPLDEIPSTFVKKFIKTIDSALYEKGTKSTGRQDALFLMNCLKIKDDEAVHEGKLEITDRSIINERTIHSNAFLFFVAGYETTSTAISCGLYELAVNPNVQEKLYSEILSGFNKDRGIFTYETLENLDYMEMFTSEVLRHYPPAPEITRLVNMKYYIPGSDVVLPPGAKITIPIYSIHHDPNYYEDPNKFIPERFSGNKERIKKGTYLPFGSGPRVCIGKRFAVMVMKVAFARILLNYKIIKCEKTKIPIEFNRQTLFMMPYGGIWVGIETRQNSP